MKKNFVLLIIFTFGFCFNSTNVFCQLLPVDLKCEYKDNPVGIETQTPRLSWTFDSSGKGLSQSAYRLCVSDSKNELQPNMTNIWDSGKVLSDNNSSIVFTGKAFDTAKRYFWRVRIWDQSGKISKWSDISEFSSGILSQNTWDSSKWIAYEDLPDSLKVLPGIHGKGDELGTKLFDPCVNPYFRKSIVINKPVTEAYAFVSGLGQLELYLNGTKVSDDFLTPGWTDNTKRCLYNSYDVTDQLQRGKNSIGCFAGAGFFYINRERYRKFIRQQEGDAGFKKIIIDPQQAGDISWVKASHLSMNGKINVEWRKDNNLYILKVEIPANSEAEVILPIQKPEDVTSNGSLVKNNDGILKISKNADKLVLTVASGEYKFICKSVLN